MNAGNLGTISRSMASFGFDNLIIIEPAVDYFNPDTIRSSMGSVFDIKLKLFTSIDDYLDESGTKRHLYSFMTDGKTYLRDIEFEQPIGLIFGNESSGLPIYYSAFSKTIQIPQTSRVDSLNLAVSVSIVLHHCYSKNI